MVRIELYKEAIAFMIKAAKVVDITDPEQYKVAATTKANALMINPFLFQAACVKIAPRIINEQRTNNILDAMAAFEQFAQLRAMDMQNNEDKILLSALALINLVNKDKAKDIANILKDKFIEL